MPGKGLPFKRKTVVSGYHVPIMAAEVVSLLACRPGGVYVDCTIGGGGHSREILDATGPDGKLIGIDRDREAIAEAGRALSGYEGRVQFVHSNFTRLDEVLAEAGVAAVDGILVDLGVSSHQFDVADRGFSFSKDGPLDMRMDQSGGETASELLLRLSEKQLASIIRDLGEERRSKAIARAIKEKGEISTTRELAEVVERAVPKRFHPKNIHVATRTFQAIRIAVNEELDMLEQFIASAVSHLNKEGRLAVISFHSLEDRIVKNVFRELSRDCVCPPSFPVCSCDREALVKVITRKGIIPSSSEIDLNPRARSARLRVAERV